MLLQMFEIENAFVVENVGLSIKNFLSAFFKIIFNASF
jgi:hypothetical protein